MVKGYSEYNSTHSKREAQKIAKEVRDRGYGARIVQRKIAKGSGKGAVVYEILKSDRKLKKR